MIVTSSSSKSMLLLTSLSVHHKILEYYPSPISLNGESERKCSKASPATALRKDLEVMRTL